MLHFLPGPLRAALAMLWVVVNTAFWATPIYTLAILKAVIPHQEARRRISGWLMRLAESWAAGNNGLIALLYRVEWDIQGDEGLNHEESYLVIANHQSWLDIVVLLKVFNRRIPYFKFFLKKNLFWVPLLGFAWWALDYPFMVRYTQAQIARRPDLKGKDLATTRKACLKFSQIPVSVMNFVEGTRFTPGKREAQKSPFSDLLRPKAAGVSFVIEAMGGCLNRILDVTIAYPCRPARLWSFLQGQIPSIKVCIHNRAIGPELIGDYQNDPAFRERFQTWINDVWTEKQRTLEGLAKKGL